MHTDQRAFILADLGFGDAGKGTITDALSQRFAAHTIIRYNGGPQAAHNVVTTTGQHHTFAQFGSGLFHPQTRTFLSRFMLVNPLNMLAEERHLQALGITNAWQRTTIDRRALIISPFQRAANRLREIWRAKNKHGSCGEGVGECIADALMCADIVIRAGDLHDRRGLLAKLSQQQDLKCLEIAQFAAELPDDETTRQEYALLHDPQTITDCADIYRFFANLVTIVDNDYMQELCQQPGTMIFEGAQGVLLDEDYAFAPYGTWSKTTFENAHSLLDEGNYQGDAVHIGILRTYASRHGAGPFPTAATELNARCPETHNSWNTWQERFRVGYLDLVTLDYACKTLGHIDYLAVTHVDRLKRLPAWKICTAYNYLGRLPANTALFTYTQEQITAINVHDPARLEQQEQLTQYLWSCRPSYQHPFSNSTMQDTNNYLAYLSGKLNIPIGITSAGPTSADKDYHLPFTAEHASPMLNRYSY